MVRTKQDNVTTSINDQQGKLPPQATDIEEAVLGAMMLERTAVRDVLSQNLKPQDFYKGSNMTIYEAILHLDAVNSPIDILTVKNTLKKMGKLEGVGGAYYVTELTTRVNSAANIEAHAIIIKEMAIKREVIKHASSLLAEAYEDTRDVFELLDSTETLLSDIQNNAVRGEAVKFDQAVKESITEIEESMKQPDGITGVPSGMYALDRITLGWQPGKLVIIAARPGLGKTAFALTAATYAAKECNTPTAFFTLEMPSTELSTRAIGLETHINLSTCHDHSVSRGYCRRTGYRIPSSGITSFNARLKQYPS